MPYALYPMTHVLRPELSLGPSALSLQTSALKIPLHPFEEPFVVLVRIRCERR